jgi:hypothetical protein
MTNASDDLLEKHLDELQTKIDDVIGFTLRIHRGEIEISFAKRVESQLHLQTLPEKLRMAEMNLEQIEEK